MGQVPFDRITIDLARGTEEQRLVRGTVPVNRDYNRVLVVSMPSGNSCLHVYDGKFLQLSTLESPDVGLMAPYSNMDLIDAEATPPAFPNLIFGGEPVHGWCYYYQSIGLALQRQDWVKAADLSDTVLASDYRPEDSFEWLPLLIAYANTSQEKKVKQVSTYINDTYTRMSLCFSMKNVTEWPDNYRSDLILGHICRGKN
jgi:hypothetical protein